MKRVSFLIAAVLLAAFSARAEDPADPVWNLRVHLLSDDERVELWQSLPPPLQGYSRVCKTPCDAVVQFRQSDQFWLAGDGLQKSEQFQFKPREGDVTLKVTSGKAAPMQLAGALSLGGGAAVLIGAGTLLWGAMGQAVCDGYRDCVSRNEGWKWTGRVLLVGGLVALAGGVAIAIFHPRTRFTEVQ